MTYPPQPEPFAEALAEAAQTAAMAYRLMMTITDAVRRATQKRLTGKEEELSQDAQQMAPSWAADQLRGALQNDVLAELMNGADWPVMARQLVALHQAGVDLDTFLPQMGRMTAGVHQAVATNAARTKAEGTDRWADLLTSTMPQGLVRDAILASPAWPDIAAAMAHLDTKGIDVTRILVDAHAAGTGVDQAIAAVTTAAAQAPTPTPAATPTPAPATPAPAVPAATPTPTPTDPRVLAPATAPGTAPTTTPAPATPTPAPAPPTGEPADPWAPPASTDAKRSWGPLTEGLNIPRDLDLGNRAKALEQLGVRPRAHAAIVGAVKDALPETQAGLLISSRPWPLLAHRMNHIHDQGGTTLLTAHLTRLTTDTTWQDGPPSTTTGRLIDATLNSLTTPPSTPATPASRSRVSPTTARSRSTTTPTTTPGQPAPTQTALPAHRQQTTPAKTTARTR
ncbi:hypothetical protein [Streptomyces sp. NPDC002057]|uniref:hypothetical protein n=1 Tax=Streptomyces sp. NPDC002057 TaxID=3154664 RepID=UPI00332C4BF3